MERRVYHVTPNGNGGWKGMLENAGRASTKKKWLTALLPWQKAMQEARLLSTKWMEQYRKSEPFQEVQTQTHQWDNKKATFNSGFLLGINLSYSFFLSSPLSFPLRF